MQAVVLTAGEGTRIRLLFAALPKSMLPVGAGKGVSNRRRDGADIEVTVKGERVSTGRQRFGVVAGDGAETEIGTNLTPGLKLTTGAKTQPGETVEQDR